MTLHPGKLLLVALGGVLALLTLVTFTVGIVHVGAAAGRTLTVVRDLSDGQRATVRRPDPPRDGPPADLRRPRRPSSTWPPADLPSVRPCATVWPPTCHGQGSN